MSVSGYKQAEVMDPNWQQEALEFMRRKEAQMRKAQMLAMQACPNGQGYVIIGSVKAVTQESKPAALAPAPLTYQEFHDIAAAQVKALCPKAKLITDVRHNGKLTMYPYWISHGKMNADGAVAMHATPEIVREVISNSCAQLRNLAANSVLT